MEPDKTTLFSKNLHLNLSSIELIQENKYCAVYRGKENNSPLIIKEYFGEDYKLASNEKNALEFYQTLSKDKANWLSGGCRQFSSDHNLLAIDYIPGKPFSDFIYQKAKSRQGVQEICLAFGHLGEFLVDVYQQTSKPDASYDPFLEEYILYVSKRLETLPFWGRLFFKDYGAQAKTLIEQFREAEITPCFCHGDFVPLNIHHDESKIGLIDFANSLFYSHTLNDLYNMYFALQSMHLPRKLRNTFWQSLLAPFEKLSFPSEAHLFYYEYHRRRWLMLNLSSGWGRTIRRGLRGVSTYGKTLSSNWPAQ